MKFSKIFYLLLILFSEEKSVCYTRNIIYLNDWSEYVLQSTIGAIFPSFKLPSGHCSGFLMIVRCYWKLFSINEGAWKRTKSAKRYLSCIYLQVIGIYLKKKEKKYRLLGNSWNGQTTNARLSLDIRHNTWRFGFVQQVRIRVNSIYW